MWTNPFHTITSFDKFKFFRGCVELFDRSKRDGMPHMFEGQALFHSASKGTNVFNLFSPSGAEVPLLRSASLP